MIAFSGGSERTDETLMNFSRSVAGHFDFYFCKEFTPDGFRKYRANSHILQQGLLECGVAKELTAVRTYGKEVIFEILDSCQPGDLLGMCMGNIEKHQLAGFIDDYIEARA